MNKSVIKYTLLLGLVLGLLCLGWGIVHQITSKKALTERTAQLPAFRFEGLDGQVVTSQEFQNKPVWLLYFDSDCEYCQMQLRDLSQNKTSISGIEVLLISSENTNALLKCRQQYGFEQHPNLTIVRDSTHQCQLLLGMTSTPNSLLYGSSGKLLKKYNGVVKTATIINNVQ